MFCALCVLSHSVMSNSVIPWTVAHKLPLSMELSRQEFWIGLPFPASEDHLDPGIILVSLSSPALAGRFFITEPHGKPSMPQVYYLNPVFITFQKWCVMFLTFWKARFVFSLQNSYWWHKLQCKLQLKTVTVSSYFKKRCYIGSFHRKW